MTLAELLTIAREEFLDDVADMEGQDDESAAASNAKLIRWAGEAEREACRHGDCKRIYDEDTAAICTLTLVQDQRSYALDPRILIVESAYYSGTSALLTHSTKEALDRDYAGWRSYDDGEPQRFYIKGKTLYLDREPSADEAGDTLTLSVWREPLRAPKQHEAPEIAAHHHYQLAHWIAYRYFSVPDAVANQPDRASMHLQSFERYFGPPVRGDVLERQLEGPAYVQHDAGRAYMGGWHKSYNDNGNDWDRTC